MPDRCRLHSLDALRGLAAICVVFWHWQHLFFNPTVGGIVFTKSAQPFYAFCHGFYNHGDRAVDLFFVLSGFVFYWLYAEKIHGRMVSAPQFAALRISRLYPLHLLTFLLVVGLQLAYIHRAGRPFVYPNFDVLMAVEHVLGVSSWIPCNPFAFNGPFWSVSIELSLYAIFFLVCRYLSLRSWINLLIILLGLSLRHVHPELYRGLVAFFLGGLSYKAFRWISSRPNVRPWLIGLGAFTVLGWTAMAHVESIVRKECQADLVFVGTILFIALLERRFPRMFTGLTPLGDISYSIYLIHFPLQLAFILVNRALGGNTAIFYHAWTLGLFLGILLPLGYLSCHAFEMPVQRFLRARLTRPLT